MIMGASAVVKVLDWWKGDDGIKYKVQHADGSVHVTGKRPALPLAEFPDSDYLATTEPCGECGAPVGEQCASWCTGSMPTLPE
jgi:hypothetical protein